MTTNLPLRIALTATCVAWLSSVGPSRVAGSEIAAKHLVYERAVKMKKIEVSLLLPFSDQSRRNDPLERPRQLSCTARATGKAGLLSVRGRLLLRLLGTLPRTSSPWSSSITTASLDEDASAIFEADAIRALVDEARAAEARVDLYRVDLDGGKGKKVRTLTIDCLHGEAQQ